MPLHAGLGIHCRYKAVESGVAIAQIAIHGIRKVKLLVSARTGVAVEAAGVLEDDQLGWIFHRQAAQQRLVEQAEDRCICANTKRQRDHCHGGECGALDHLPPGIAHVLEYAFHRTISLVVQSGHWIDPGRPHCGNVASQ